MAITPTQRTLRALRNEGRICEIAEKWVPTPGSKIPGFRKDLFGFIDIIVLCPQKGILAVQSFGSAWSAHVKKILDSEITQNVIDWINCGGSIELWGWRKVKIRRGGKALRWSPRMAEVVITQGKLEVREI